MTASDTILAKFSYLDKIRIFDSIDEVVSKTSSSLAESLYYRGITMSCNDISTLEAEMVLRHI